MPDKTLGEVLHEARVAGGEQRPRPWPPESWADRDPQLRRLDEDMAEAVAAAVRYQAGARLAEVRQVAVTFRNVRAGVLHPEAEALWHAVIQVIDKMPLGGQEQERSDEKAVTGSLRIYLAGPMRGVPEFNHPAFNTATALLREAGHEVFNPAEYDRSKGYDFTGHDGTEDLAAIGFSLRRALGADLAWITARADAVVVLPGWEKSAGARAETATARALGLPVCEISQFLADGHAAAPVAAELDGQLPLPGTEP